MTEAETILQLIQSASPDDTAKLREIDWTFFQWLYPGRYVVDNDFRIGMDSFLINGAVQPPYSLINLRRVPQYTRSCDALKAIRPEGWTFEIQKVGKDGYTCRYGDVIHAPYSPTEELAELHAIIQAIAYERSQNTRNPTHVED